MGPDAAARGTPYSPRRRRRRGGPIAPTLTGRAATTSWRASGRFQPLSRRHACGRATRTVKGVGVHGPRDADGPDGGDSLQVCRAASNRPPDPGTRAVVSEGCWRPRCRSPKTVGVHGQPTPTPDPTAPIRTKLARSTARTRRSPLAPIPRSLGPRRRRRRGDPTVSQGFCGRRVHGPTDADGPDGGDRAETCIRCRVSPRRSMRKSRDPYYRRAPRRRHLRVRHRPLRASGPPSGYRRVSELPLPPSRGHSTVDQAVRRAPRPTRPRRRRRVLPLQRTGGDPVFFPRLRVEVGDPRREVAARSKDRTSAEQTDRYITSSNTESAGRVKRVQSRSIHQKFEYRIHRREGFRRNL